MSVIEIRPDDLTGHATRALITAHLDAMHADTPAESVHALGLDELAQPSITVWSAWSRGELAGVAALKELESHRGEIKSMRVRDSFRGEGVGRALLQHLIEVAKERRMTSLWLETGTTDDFVAARHLYERAGFIECGPFEGYVADPLSIFMRRLI
ncbi:acetyltransferase [Microbacterium mangrovi]|uniref:Acetyltransferase n=1 Tax=Microbacterium mangrovi TaxID=1348253 RepID=A0A0B2A7E8_9MICO|nr:GNAT family N-acetyltransferase [Microbacterium mangrovi]KHK99020.1 acetyltransferase [Microbacterium mangrovi]